MGERDWVEEGESESSCCCTQSSSSWPSVSGYACSYCRYFPGSASSVYIPPHNILVDLA